MSSNEQTTKTMPLISQNNNNSAVFRLIGFGACGAIYAQDGSPVVFKLAKAIDNQLWNDYTMHTRVWEAFKQTPEIALETTIPEPGGFVPRDHEGGGDQWWTTSCGQQLTTAVGNNLNMPTRALWSERIFPLPLPLRSGLTGAFCAPQLQHNAFTSPGNADCLVRIYLGSRIGRSGLSFFSLRNFKLHLNQLEDLGQDTYIMQFAGYMANALAVMHWRARVDARDVEFVLGNARPRAHLVRTTPPELAKELEKLPVNSLVQPHPEATVLSGEQKQRMDDPTSLGFWLLDFNQCGDMAMNSEGVKRAVDAFWVNDPYYPRPPKRGDDETEHEAARKNPHFAADKALWCIFSAQYLRMSRNILVELGKPEWEQLPVEFVTGVEHRAGESWR
ncbi:zinc finger protein-domain-containing protein [Phyllosticta capitalensis]